MEKYKLQVSTTWTGRVVVAIYDKITLCTITKTFCMKEELKLLERYLSAYGFTLEDAYISQQQLEGHKWQGSAIDLEKRAKSKVRRMIAYLKNGYTKLSLAIASFMKKSTK